MQSAIPAATVIIVRDLPEGHEVLMVERHAQLVFAGGAAVFPGGRVDEDDRRIVATPALCPTSSALDGDDAAARVAAIRESLEETGIGIGIHGLPAAHWPAWRNALNQGVPFSDMLGSERLRLNLDLLDPFARWRPNFKETRTFDTRFYLTKAPADAPEPGEADGSETTRIFWISPRRMLALADGGSGRVIFPTRRNLERLAAHQGYAALQAHARSVPVRTITPWVEEQDGQQWLTIPDDLGYPVIRERLSDAQRG